MAKKKKHGAFNPGEVQQQGINRAFLLFDRPDTTLDAFEDTLTRLLSLRPMAALFVTVLPRLSLAQLVEGDPPPVTYVEFWAQADDWYGGVGLNTFASVMARRSEGLSRQHRMRVLACLVEDFSRRGAFALYDGADVERLPSLDLSVPRPSIPFEAFVGLGVSKLVGEPLRKEWSDPRAFNQELFRRVDEVPCEGARIREPFLWNHQRFSGQVIGKVQGLVSGWLWF